MGAVYRFVSECTTYSSHYRFSPGDDPSWRNPEFDDRQWTTYAIDEFPNDRWTGVGWFRYILTVDSSAIGMAIYLLRTFAYTNRELELRLNEVRQLSAKNLQQEIERIALESENTRKTRESEAAAVYVTYFPACPEAGGYGSIYSDRN